MKHIIIPFLSTAWTEEELLACMSPEERERTGMICPGREHEPPTLLHEGTGGSCQCVKIGLDTPAIVRDTLDHLRDLIYDGEGRYVVDVLADAERVTEAERLLEKLRGVQGDHYSIHVIFLYESRGSHSAEQAAFFARLRQDVLKKDGPSGLAWNWLTILGDEDRNGISGEDIRHRRRVLLPYLLKDPHRDQADHQCVTYAVELEELRTDLIEQVPHAQAVRYACERLLEGEMDRVWDVLVMGKGGTSVKEHRDSLKQSLLAQVGQWRLLPEDLLIQKHDPAADVPTRELLKAVLRDQPDRDARLYDGAESEEELLALTKVRMAVEAWQRSVLAYARNHTGLRSLRDQFRTDSEWAQLIAPRGGFAEERFADDPLSLCVSEARGDLGYSPKAADALRSEVLRVGDGLSEAIFCACLRALWHRLTPMYEELDRIIRERERAVEAAREALRPVEQAEKMMPRWCDRLRQDLSTIAADVPVPVEDQSPSDLIESYAAELLKKLGPKIRPREGRDEMVGRENTDAIVRGIISQRTPCALISARLMGTTAVEGTSRWSVDS